MAESNPDDFTFRTDAVEIQMNEDGCCVRHPHIQLRVQEGGYVYQKESCPDCEADLDHKLQEMKQKRYDLDKKLEDLELDEQQQDTIPISSMGVPPAAAPASAPYIYSARPRYAAPPPLPVAAPTLASLSQQIAQMQQTQDWLLHQKEQEMTLLRQKVEDQQKELIKKEVEMALLKEKLSQQESRMQHELKLIKMAAYKRSRQHNSSSRSLKSGGEEERSEPKQQETTTATARAARNIPQSNHHHQEDAYVVVNTGSNNNNNHTNGNNNNITATKDHSSEESYEQVMLSSSPQPRKRESYEQVMPSSPQRVGTPVPENKPEDQSPVLSSPVPPAPTTLLPSLDSTGSEENMSSEQQDQFDVNFIPYNKTTQQPQEYRKPKFQASNDDEILQRGINLSGDVPVNIDLSAPNTVELEEQVTMDTFLGADASRFEHAAPHQQQPQPQQDNTDALTMGNTVATSTYGEDRHKVVNRTVLDPYGDSGLYTGVVLLTTGMPHGLGRMLYEDDGRTYEGDWRHGRWHGYGKATFANGDAYEGEYRFDQRHGRGLYQWSDGRQYDGDFYEDKRHGRGTFKWPDGAIYEGDFVQGQREGHGRYSFADGGQYVGEWVDGRYEGYGECEWSDGRSYKGEWSQGMAHGRGVETFADGTVRHDGLWDSDDPIPEEC